MLKDHPVIERIERIGYPYEKGEDDGFRGFDALGNVMYKDDVILELDDKQFVWEQLNYETIHALSILGAEREIVE